MRLILLLSTSTLSLKEWKETFLRSFFWHNPIITSDRQVKSNWPETGSNYFTRTDRLKKFLKNYRFIACTSIPSSTFPRFLKVPQTLNNAFILSYLSLLSKSLGQTWGQCSAPGGSSPLPHWLRPAGRPLGRSLHWPGSWSWTDPDTRRDASCGINYSAFLNTIKKC